MSGWFGSDEFDASAEIQVENQLRVFDYLRKLAANSDHSTSPLTPEILREIHRIGMDRLVATPGAFREESSHDVTIVPSSHEPPASRQVAEHVTELCAYLRTEWLNRDPVFLAAYALWRINWIHPLTQDGNGRAARAAAYLILCVRFGFWLPGTVTVPELLVKLRKEYIAALEEADAACAGGNMNVDSLQKLIRYVLIQQLGIVGAHEHK